MNILLTGSSGWLGRYLAPLLREKGHSVFGLDPAPGEYTSRQGSIVDAALVRSLFEEQSFDAVVHAGALHKPDIARYPMQSFVDVNVSGTLNLLEAASQHRVQRFVFTSSTSLMISQKIRDEQFADAVWLNEEAGPLEPRNIYGVTKLAAEGLCRQMHQANGLPVIILRTSRFFPEDDDTVVDLSGPNLKANELLHRRATVQDMARAHLAALYAPESLGFGLYIVSAPTPFTPDQCPELKSNARDILKQLFPDMEALYRKEGRIIPRSIGRIYDGSRITRSLEFNYKTAFEDLLADLRQGLGSPIVHDPKYTSPLAHTLPND